jgi:CBS domain-containing protein
VPSRSIPWPTAGEIMTTPPIYVMEETPVQEIARVMIGAEISGVPVLGSGGRLVGIVSEGDLIRRSPSGRQGRRSWWLDLFEDDAIRNEGLLNYLRRHGLRAKDVMSTEVIVAEPSTPLALVAGLLEIHRIKRVPVLRDGALVGIVSRANVLAVLARMSRSAGDLRRSSDRSRSR